MWDDLVDLKELFGDAFYRGVPAREDGGAGGARGLPYCYDVVSTDAAFCVVAAFREVVDRAVSDADAGLMIST